VWCGLLAASSEPYKVASRKEIGAWPPSFAQMPRENSCEIWRIPANIVEPSSSEAGDRGIQSVKS
jgi:hypothetical protein